MRHARTPVRNASGGSSSGRRADQSRCRRRAVNGAGITCYRDAPASVSTVLEAASKLDPLRRLSAVIGRPAFQADTVWMYSNRDGESGQDPDRRASRNVFSSPRLRPGACSMRCASGCATCTTAYAPRRPTSTGCAPSSAGTGMRHPREMGAAEVEAFLTMLATERRGVGFHAPAGAERAAVPLPRRCSASTCPGWTSSGRPVPPKRIAGRAHARRGAGACSARMGDGGTGPARRACSTAPACA